MKTRLLPIAALGLLVSFASQAAPPAGAPAGATALCKDGSYFSGAEKKGACSGHKGLKTWFGAATAKAAPAAKSAAAPLKPNPAASTAAKPATAAAKPMAPAKPASTDAKPATAAKTAPVAPGKSGMVWANSDTKVYHCPNSRWYGKTKNGKYLSEADAKAQGMRPDRNKGCS